MFLLHFCGKWKFTLLTNKTKLWFEIKIPDGEIKKNNKLRSSLIDQKKIQLKISKDSY
jgi:hypothetical protein